MEIDEEKLGVRKFSDITKMMAGYYSYFTHNAVFDLLKDRIPLNSVVADIGAGEGAFSERLRNNGYQVLAVENFCDFKPKEILLYKLNLNEFWHNEISVKMDAVVCIEIIEHVENPFNFLRQIRSIVKENGLVFISTPNVLNFENRFNLFRTGLLDMMSHPDHRSPIFPETMQKFCSESGFEIIFRSYDIDTLSIKGKTLKARLMRKIARFARAIFTSDQYSKGNSNIWILKPSTINVYVPPSHT